jgi:hypothetical protein
MELLIYAFIVMRSRFGSKSAIGVGKLTSTLGIDLEKNGGTPGSEKIYGGFAHLHSLKHMERTG